MKYYIRMLPRTAGSKRDRKPRRSEQSYNDLETAIFYMHKFVHEQKKLSMRQLGMVAFNEMEINDGLGVVLEIVPALMLIKGLRLTFTVETEGE